MPRNDLRAVTFSDHAGMRLAQRGVKQADAVRVIRAGAWYPDGEGRFGEPKWYAQGSFAGQVLRIVFVETVAEIGAASVESLHVVTVIAPKRER